eukprot:tig00000147_g9505.t1
MDEAGSDAAALAAHRQQPPAPGLLDLPDALLQRAIELACTSEEEGRYQAILSDLTDAKLRAVAAGEELATAGRELRVDLRPLSRLRRVCKRFAELVEARGAAPPARLEVRLSPESSAREELDRGCEGAARVYGGEIADLEVKIVANEGKPDATFSLAPLARLRSLRALRMSPNAGAALKAPDLTPAHVAPLASLAGLSRLDLSGGAAGLRTTPPALAALSPLPLATLRAPVVVGPACTPVKVLADVAAAFPGLRDLLLAFLLEHRPQYQIILAPDTLAPLAPLTSLRALVLKLSQNVVFSSLRPLAALPQLEYLSIDYHGSELRPISSLTSLRALSLHAGLCDDLSFLRPLTRLEALNACTDGDPARLLPLAPRLRCLVLEHEGRASAALADALLRCTALEDLSILAGWGLYDALSRRSLAPWGRLRSLDAAVDTEMDSDPIPPAFFSRVSSDLRGLRELEVGPTLPLPLPPDVVAAFRGRLRRLRAHVVDRGRPHAEQAEQRARQAELEGALGFKIEPAFTF